MWKAMAAKMQLRKQLLTSLRIHWKMKITQLRKNRKTESMRKYFLTGVGALMLTLPALAQKSNVTSAWMYLKHSELDNAVKSIDEAIGNAETKDDPKTWMYRGNVYDAINLVKNPKYS